MMINELRRRLVVVADHLTFHAYWVTEGYTAADLLYLGRAVRDLDEIEDAVRLSERMLLGQILGRQGWRRELCIRADGEAEFVLMPPPEAVAACERRMALEPDDCLQCWLEGRYDDDDPEVAAMSITLTLADLEGGPDWVGEDLRYYTICPLGRDGAQPDDIPGIVPPPGWRIRRVFPFYGYLYAELAPHEE